MSETDRKGMRHAVSRPAEEQTATEKLVALESAFALFSQEAVRIEQAYQQLSEDYQHIHSRLIQKVRELDVTTHYLQNILANMSQGLMFINLSGTITTLNHTGAAILGVDSIEVLFRPYPESFTDELFGFSMAEALATRTNPPSPQIITRGQGAEARLVEIDARLVLKQKGSTAPTTRDAQLDYTEGLILLIRDVTEMGRLRRQAERVDRLKDLGEMAAMVAHEIRNPLGGIKGFASLLQRDLADQPHLRQMATYILEGTEALNRLVNSILNYSKPIRLRLENVDLVPFLLDLLYGVRLDAKLTQGIEYTLDVNVADLKAQVDPHLLHLALLNLVVNAVQAMPRGGEITFSLKSTGKEALIEVRDTGEGISAENREKIFTPFFTTKSGGSGFGLTEVLKIAEAHGGTVDVQSEIDKGSTFSLKLPIEGPTHGD